MTQKCPSKIWYRLLPICRKYRVKVGSGIKIVEISKFEIFSYVTDSDAKFIVDSEYVLIFTLSLLVFEMSI